MNNEIKEIKIGMYSTDEILEFMTNGEGRGFLGRSMYDAIIDYITNLQNENEFLKLNNPEMNIEHFRIVKENKRKIDNLRKENERLNNIIETLDKMFEYYFLGNLKYDQDTVNTIYIKYIKLKELKKS